MSLLWGLTLHKNQPDASDISLSVLQKIDIGVPSSQRMLSTFGYIHLLITFLKFDFCFVDNNITEFLLIFLSTSIWYTHLQNQFIIMKSLIAIVFLLTNQGTSVCSLRDRANVFFNKAYKNAQRQLRGISSSSGGISEGVSMVVRNLQWIQHLLQGSWHENSFLMQSYFRLSF